MTMQGAQETGSSKKGERITGLDAIRFLAASFVVFGHCGNPPLTEGLDRGDGIAWLIHGVYANLLPAVPAVIVFFVISGFCIHYPYRDLGKLAPLPYLARRYLRICIPVMAAVQLARPLGVNLSLFQNSVLWSLLAELIYYTLYPFLRAARRAVGWWPLIIASYVLAVGAILLHPHALDYSPFGPQLSWLVAAPCWLLGCQLAEVDFAKLRATALGTLWRWRLTVWFLAWLCSVLRFHSPVGYPWTLNFFAIAVFCWLRWEIATAKSRNVNRWLEWGGAWSYSIYLVHLLANQAFSTLDLPNLGFNLNWCLRMGFIFGMAYVFYLLVEWPSHRIARYLGRRLQEVSWGRKRSPVGEGVQVG